MACACKHMNSFIDPLNYLGARFADFALAMFVQSSLLIVLLFALDLVLRNRVRAVVRYALWMLVLIKLVLPPSFAAPTSLAYWLSETKAVKTNLAVACRVLLPNAGGLVVDGGGARDASGKNHWLIVSPTAVDARGNPIKP